MMVDRPGLSLVPQGTILAGVVLLLTSVFHALLMWLGVASLALGLLLLLAECLEAIVPRNGGAGYAISPGHEPEKEN